MGLVIRRPFWLSVGVYLNQRRKRMTGETMTLKEKLSIGVKAAELRDAGRDGDALALEKTVPMPPFLAKILKEKAGDYLIKSGWNLSEAEAAFGKDWLSR
jgi:hypothetical protein